MRARTGEMIERASLRRPFFYAPVLEQGRNRPGAGGRSRLLLFKAAFVLSAVDRHVTLSWFWCGRQRVPFCGSAFLSSLSAARTNNFDLAGSGSFLTRFQGIAHACSPFVLMRHLDKCASRLFKKA